MPKNKRACSPAASADASPKRQRAALNFSIEAIMQSAGASGTSAPTASSGHQLHQNQQYQNNHHHQQIHQNQNHLYTGDGRDSPLDSDVSSRLGSSSPEQFAASAAAAAATTASPAGSARSSPLSVDSSRASTPISPGFAAGPAGVCGRASSASSACFAPDIVGLAGLGNFQQLLARPSASQNQNQSHQQQQQRPSSGAGQARGQQQHSSVAGSTSATRNHHSKSADQARRSNQQAAGSSSNVNNNNRSSSNNSGRLAQVECILDNKDMWDKFHALNTEMIITKTGRRMFPVMKVQFRNLDPNARYAVSMDIVPVDNKRYRYAYHKSCWQIAGKADPSAEPRLYPHPDSPFNGDLLSRQVISFEKVKLTNNEMDKSGHIILNSMHKYQPRIHLIELKVSPPNQAAGATSGSSSAKTTSTQSDHYHTTNASNNTSNNHHHNQHHNQHHQHHQHQHHNQHHHSNNHQQSQENSQLGIEGYRTFVFPETVFTAVTAYQNQLITKMKIDKNPFAKGFRDSSRLSDLDRSDPFDYMGPSGGRFPGGAGASGGPLDAATAAAAAAHMDAYQLLASAANNPWYSAAAVAAAAGASNPFNPMGACSSAQLQATQMWLALSAAFNGGVSPGGPAGPMGAAAMGLGAVPPGAGLMPALAGQSPHLSGERGTPLGETGRDSSCGLALGASAPGGAGAAGSGSCSANSSGTSA